jgi:hypothetical protein
MVVEQYYQEQIKEEQSNIERMKDMQWEAERKNRNKKTEFASE